MRRSTERVMRHGSGLPLGDVVTSGPRKPRGAKRGEARPCTGEAKRQARSFCSSRKHEDEQRELRPLGRLCRRTAWCNGTSVCPYCPGDGCMGVRLALRHLSGEELPVDKHGDLFARASSPRAYQRQKLRAVRAQAPIGICGGPNLQPADPAVLKAKVQSI